MKNDSIYRLYFEFCEKLLQSHRALCHSSPVSVCKNVWYWKKIAFFESEKNALCNLLPWSTVANNALYSDLFCILTKAVATHTDMYIRWLSRFQSIKLDVISYDGIWCGILLSLRFSFWATVEILIFYCIDDKIKIISKHAICLPWNTVHK